MLVDFGNTRLKWALWNDGRPELGGVFVHRGTSLEAALMHNWSSFEPPQSIHVASVVGDDLEHALSVVIEKHFAQSAEFVRSPAHGLGVRNAYREPQRLGVDRFLAMAALHAASPRAQVLVSCGTALTLDALDADGRHLGGLIAPSPSVMRVALGGATARVGESTGHLVEIADNTNDATWSGTALAAIALIERFHAAAGARLGEPAALVGDGGGIDEWMALLPAMERGRDLVLRGLALWAQRHDPPRKDTERPADPG